MAKPTETPHKKKSLGEMAVWGLMAMVILGLGGFGVRNFGGSASAVATVGDRKITANDYARQLQQQLNGLSQQFGKNVTLSEARAFGIDRQVIAGLVNLAAEDAEAERLGLSVGDAVVASQLVKIPAFQGVSGKFDRETYAFTLKRNNLTEARFEQELRDDMARSLLSGAVKGGFQSPAALTDTLYAWMGERRGISVLPLGAADLAHPVADPDEAALKAWYDAHLADYTRPQAKSITYAALIPSEIADKAPVDEAAVKTLYDQRADQYIVPEKRLVERLVFPDQAAADAAKARLDAGLTFDDLVRERGLSLSDIDMGDVTRADLATAGDAVFALAEPGIAGPALSNLGPALFRVNAILSPETTPFEQVRDELTAEVRDAAARKQIEGKVEAIDDALAGGATLDDLAREQGMRLGRFDYAPGAADNDPIAGSAAFRTAADAAKEGDFPEAVTLEDGGVVAIEVKGTVPPAALPFDQVRDKVAAAWKADALATALQARAAEIKAAVEGGARLEAFGIVDATPELPREGTINGAPDDAMKTVFQMKPGEIRVIEGPGYTAVLRVDQVIPAARTGAGPDALRDAIRAQIDKGLSEDAAQLWSAALADQSGISIDQQALDAVNAQFN